MTASEIREVLATEVDWEAVTGDLEPLRILVAVARAYADLLEKGEIVGVRIDDWGVPVLGYGDTITQEAYDNEARYLVVRMGQEHVEVVDPADPRYDPAIDEGYDYEDGDGEESL